MPRFARRMLLAALAATTVLGLKHFACEPLAAAAGKPVIPKFQIQYWDIPNRAGSLAIWDFNNSGQVAGWFVHATGETRIYLYDPATIRTTATDLIDAIQGAGLPEGWRISQGQLHLNDHGVILGSMSTIDPNPTTGVRDSWVYLLDTRSPSPEIVPLPAFAGVLACLPIGLNDNGDIVCSYKPESGPWNFFLYNPAIDDEPLFLDPMYRGVKLGEAIDGLPAMIGGRYGDGLTTAYRAVPELGLFSTVPWSGGGSMFIQDMNSSGVFVGLNGNLNPVRLVGSTMQTFSLPSGTRPVDVNESNDVLFNKVYLFRDDVGTINLRSYLKGSKSDLAIFTGASSVSTAKCNDRDLSTDYSQVCGSLTRSDGVVMPFLLTPVITSR